MVTAVRDRCRQRIFYKGLSAYLSCSAPFIFLVFEISHVFNTIASGVLNLVTYIPAPHLGLTPFRMAPPTKDEIVKAFIDLVSHTRVHSPNLSSSLFLIINEADIETISHSEVTMIPLLCTLLASVTELRTEVSMLGFGLEALDTHTGVLPTISQLQEVVGDKVTAPLASTLRDLSHQVTGSAPPQIMAQGCPPQSPPPHTGVTNIGCAPPGQTMPNTVQQPTGMDPDISRFDTTTKTFFGNPEAYPAKFSTSWEANTFREEKYPPHSSFVLGNYDPLVAGPSASNCVALGLLRVCRKGALRGQVEKARNVPP